MTAPYVIRDPAGFWHLYQLPAWEDAPYGVSLIIYLQPGEHLECQPIVDALKGSLRAGPAGEWYRVTVAERYVRESPVTGKVVFTLGRNDRIQVVSKTLLNTWGRIIAYKRFDQLKMFDGYVYLASLQKE